MTRTLLVRLVACLATGLVALAVTPGAAPPAQAAEGGDTPLQVSIATLAPSVIPRHGRITITGQVTNRSDSTWTDLNVYLLTSPEPMTSGAELAEAAETDPTTEIGGRLYRPGLYDEIGDLAPGSSTSYTLSVARKDLRISGAPGAYWLGVHVLGAEQGLRDVVADGRARTFIPLMRPNGPDTTLSLVLPLRAPVKRDPDGRLSEPGSWAQLLSPEGRLGRLLDLSGTALGAPLTWVVDPAVLDAAKSLRQGNPQMYAGPTDGEDQGDGTASPTASPSTSPDSGDDTGTGGSTDGSAGDGADEEAAQPEPSESAQVADTWLSTFRRQADQHTVLATPYGELDLAAALRGRRSGALFEQASALTTTTLEELGIDADPVVAPPSGYLPESALADIDADTPVILGDQALPEARRPVVASHQGHPIVLTDSSAGSGGPGPTPPYKTLAMRQRILSEAAVHALSADADQPLVVTTPATWEPGGDWRIADFFAGLSVPWLRMVDVPSVTLGAAEPYDGELVYPRRERRAELPRSNLRTSRRLVDAGNAYAALLSRNDTVDEFLGKSAMIGSSYQVRRHPDAAAQRVAATRTVIRARMGQISIDAPPFVTMSSAEGSFQVTIVNGLDEPVTVGIQARVEDEDLSIRAPDPVSLGPGQRTAVLLHASSTGLGVHSVTLRPVNVNEQPLGGRTEFPLRSSQVSLVIWVILGAGAAVFVVAFAIRISRRVRGRESAR